VDVADLLALIRTLDLGRVLLVANSLGAVIALGAAVTAPELVAQVIAHEPPLFDLLDSAPNEQELARRTRSALTAAVEAARSGNYARAAQIFVEEVSGATNAWSYLPPDIQQGFTNNASGFLTDVTPSEQLHLPLEKLRQLHERLVITRGAVSPPFLKIIGRQLCLALIDSPSHVFSEAGHVPHQTCPQDFTSAVLRLATSYLESHVPTAESDAGRTHDA
jgi:pimeloyl-ACP methyl ester carboxylesterase